MTDGQDAMHCEAIEYVQQAKVSYPYILAYVVYTETHYRLNWLIPSVDIIIVWFNTRLCLIFPEK